MEPVGPDERLKNHFHILKLELHDPRGVPGSAIAIVPIYASSDPRLWMDTEWACFYPEQKGPMKAVTELNWSIFSDDEEGINIINRIVTHPQFLVTERNTQVVLLNGDFSTWARICDKVKPLWDEHAMLYNSTPKLRNLLLRKLHFGTWADAVLQYLCDLSCKNAFRWHYDPIRPFLNEVIRFKDASDEDDTRDPDECPYPDPSHKKIEVRAE